MQSYIHRTYRIAFVQAVYIGRKIYMQRSKPLRKVIDVISITQAVFELLFVLPPFRSCFLITNFASWLSVEVASTDSDAAAASASPCLVVTPERARVCA